MSTNYIHSFNIKNLWDYRDFNLTFHKDVNILIGPNASGKTTILNLLHHILTADLMSLIEIEFNEAVIVLSRFDNDQKSTVKVRSTKQGFEYELDGRSFTIESEAIPRPTFPYRKRLLFKEHKPIVELTELLNQLILAVWLPVSRRLPIAEEEELIYSRSKFEHRLELESVDERLRELMRELSQYRLRLDAQLSVRYKEFEKHVLEIILFSKEHDTIKSLKIEAIPTQDEKEQLIRAFKVAGLFDRHMQKRIDEHFSASEGALTRLKEQVGKKELSMNFDDFLIVPLVGRTKTMIQSARQLEQERETIFEPLRKYEKIVNSFLNKKVIKVEDNGELVIESIGHSQQKYDPFHLSSGEKQILILLTQALIYEDQQVVYVADEPELSLHVSWQEKLLKSLIEVGKQIQIIVATHSPDIVSTFVDKTIDLGSENK